MFFAYLITPSPTPIALAAFLKYKSEKPFSWFPEEVSSARRDGDSNPMFKQLGDTYKLKGNSFYVKMIEDLIRHIKTMFTTNEDLVDQSFRSRYFEGNEWSFRDKKREKRVNITRPY